MELVEVSELLELRIELLDRPMATPLGPITDSAMPALLKIHARNQTYAALSAAFAAAACCVPGGRMSRAGLFEEANPSGLS